MDMWVNQYDSPLSIDTIMARVSLIIEAMDDIDEITFFCERYEVGSFMEAKAAILEQIEETMNYENPDHENGESLYTYLSLNGCDIPTCLVSEAEGIHWQDENCY